MNNKIIFCLMLILFSHSAFAINMNKKICYIDEVRSETYIDGKISKNIKLLLDCAPKHLLKFAEILGFEEDSLFEYVSLDFKTDNLTEKEAVSVKQNILMHMCSNNYSLMSMYLGGPTETEKKDIKFIKDCIARK